MAKRYIDHAYLDTDGNIPMVRIGKAITSIAETNYSILTTSGTVLAANTGRRYAHIQNNGTYRVHLNLGATAVLDHGIKLAAGEHYEINDNNRYTGVISGISATTGQSVMVLYG